GKLTRFTFAAQRRTGVCKIGETGAVPPSGSCVIGGTFSCRKTASNPVPLALTAGPLRSAAVRTRSAAASPWTSIRLPSAARTKASSRNVVALMVVIDNVSCASAWWTPSPVAPPATGEDRDVQHEVRRRARRPHVRDAVRGTRHLGMCIEVTADLLDRL